jgi:competence protein ComEA
LVLDGAGAQEWETLRDCRLVTSFLNDGDSFLVSHGKKEHVFRLYFVDSPEVSNAFPERVEEQCRYFGISDQDILQLGREASAFTQDLLSGRFTVHTRWEDGMGQAKRHLAIIEVDGRTLPEWLVANGLARIYGFPAPSAWPGGESADRMRTTLRRAEDDAKARRLGGWGSLRPARSTRPRPVSPAPVGPVVGSVPSAAGGIDLNLATARELESLPGIGPVLAGRIIAGRPWFRIEDLSQVQGIRDSLIEDLRPRITIAEGSSLPETANYYRQNRARYLGREVHVSVAAIEEKGWPAPDGFVVLSALTAVKGQPGGTIPLFIPEDRLDRVREFFRTPGTLARTTAVFFSYENTDVLVIPRN